MLKTFGSHVRGNVVGYIAVFIALGGTSYAATGGNFILGNPNSASSTTALTAPVAGKGLQVTNTSTGTGATALGLTTASGHSPFTVNSGTKVANLNADKIDGLDSTSFVPSSGFRRIATVTDTPSNGGHDTPVLAGIGNFVFRGDCFRNASGQDAVGINITSGVNHSAYASLTQNAAGGGLGSGDMNAGTGYNVAFIAVSTGTADMNPISGSVVDPSGQELIFNLYQGVNARNQAGQCIWGGTIAVK